MRLHACAALVNTDRHGCITRWLRLRDCQPARVALIVDAFRTRQPTARTFLR